MTTKEVTADAVRPEKRDAAGLLIVLAAGIYILCAVLNARPLQSANDRSRWCTIWSLVERGTYQIDEIDSVPEWSTIDKVRHRQSDDEEYHFYSSKPPLFPTMVAGLYWLEKHTLGYDLREDTTLVTRILLLLVNAVPMFLALLALRKSLLSLEISAAARNLTLLAAGFASMLNPFLTTLNNHTPAAVCLVFSLAAIVRLRQAAEPKPWDFAVVGFSAALTCCFELPAALYGLLSFFVVVMIDWKKTAKFYVPAALIPLAAFFVTNWICTGGIKPFYTYYGTEKYVYVHEGIPSYWSEPQGIDANQESTLVYLFHCVLGHHGILSLSPIYLLTLAGWFIGWRSDRHRSLHTVWLLGALISAVVLTFYMTRTQNYNYGGNSAALRWMLWLTPFWWFGMVPAVDALTSSRKGLLLIAVLSAASVFSSLYSLTEPWKPGWIFVQMEKAGWIDYRTKIPEFDPPRFALLNNLPEDGSPTVFFRGAGDAKGQRIVVNCGEVLQLADAQALQLTVRRESTSDAAVRIQPEEVEVFVRSDGFESGRDIAHWVRTAAPQRSLRPTDKWNSLRIAPTWVTTLLRGLPSPRKYNPASPRYFKYTNAAGERTAIKCERAASRVAFEHPEHGRCWHRCDVLYSDKVALGVVYWKITVTQDKTNKTVGSEVWTCENLP